MNVFYMNDMVVDVMIVEIGCFVLMCCEQKEVYENNKLFKWIVCQVGQVIGDYNMIEQGDKVMVCLLGGKDSYVMFDVLLCLCECVLIDFDIVVVNFDQKQLGFFEYVLFEYLKQVGVLFYIENQDIYSIVKWFVFEGKMICLLCLWLCCGILYCVVGEFGVIKIVFGYYCDDIVQMLLLNMFYGGKLKGMLLKLQLDDGKNIVICLFVYVKEIDFEKYVELCEFLIILCNLCGSQLNLKCVEMKVLICDWDKCFLGCVDNMFNVFVKVVLLYLMDMMLYLFQLLCVMGEVDLQGDIVFDEELCVLGDDIVMLGVFKLILIVQFDDL